MFKRMTQRICTIDEVVMSKGGEASGLRRRWLQWSTNNGAAGTAVSAFVTPPAAGSASYVQT